MITVVYIAFIGFALVLFYNMARLIYYTTGDRIHLLHKTKVSKLPAGSN